MFGVLFMQLLAFTGPRSVGKTTTAKLISNLLYNTKDVFVLSFADYLRDWISKSFWPGLVGLTQSRASKDVALHRVYLPPFSGEETSIILETKLSPRDIMIEAGTFLRKVNSDVFCYALDQRIKNINENNPDSLIVIDDLRFIEEYHWIKSLDFPTFTINMERIDTQLGTEDVKDYLDFELTDYMYQTETYKDPYNNPKLLDEITSLVRELTGIEGPSHAKSYLKE